MALLLFCTMALHTPTEVSTWVSLKRQASSLTNEPYKGHALNKILKDIIN